VRSWRWTLSASIASVVLFLLAMPPGYFAVGAFFAWAPLLACIAGRLPVRANAITWGVSLFVCWAVMTWPLAAYPVLAFNQPLWLSALLILLHGLWGCAPYALAAGIGAWLVRRHAKLGLIVAPLIFTGLTVGWPTAFPGGLYLAWYRFPWAYGWAEFGGIWMLSIWLFAFNWLFALIGQHAWSRRSPAWTLAGIFIALLFVFIGVGFWRAQSWKDREQAALAAGASIEVALIQPAFPPPNAKQGNLPFPSTYTREDLLIIPLSLEAVGENPDLDLVVWPEFPLRIDYLTNPETRGFIDSWRANTSAALLFSSLESVGPDEAASVAHFLLPGSNESEMRLKKRLIPMSEYLPCEQQFPALRRLFPNVNDLQAGANFQPFELPPGIRIAPLICYDDAFPGVSRKFEEAGANVLVSLSDDSWFGDTRFRDLRVAVGMLRSIETGLPWLRVGNANRTLVVLPSGQIFGESEIPEFHRGFLVKEIPVLVDRLPVEE